MALVSPQHSWPHMIEVAPCIWLYGRTSKFFQLHGLLLFCIIMGLHSAISAEIYINSLFWSAGYCSWGRQWQTQIITKVRVFTKDRVSTSRQPSISILPFYALPSALHHQPHPSTNLSPTYSKNESKTEFIKTSATAYNLSLLHA